MPGGPLLAMMCLATDEYIGAEACKTCHADPYVRHSTSAHAFALRRTAQHPLASKFAAANSVTLPPKFNFSLERVVPGFSVRADDGKYAMELPLEWAFGAGRRAVTFVSKVDQQYHLEYSLTYFQDTASLDLTPRHKQLQCTNLHQAMGQPIRSDAGANGIASCFPCRSTGQVSISAADVKIGEVGIQCEACHGPDGTHRTRAVRGSLEQARKAIGNPKQLGSEELSRFCGNCHRTTSADFDWNSPWNVRHQPPYLARSSCFLKSGGKLTCLTCHNPHENAPNDAAYYGAVCVRCHDPKAASSCPTCRPTDLAGCVACHMPSVEAAVHLRFTNHWIAIRR